MTPDSASITPTAARSSLRRSTRALARGATVAAAFVLSACAATFDAAKYTNPVELYRASSQRFQRHKWDDALAGFDRLASQLPARDTLLPRVYFAQGQARARKGEHLLAAQAYARIQDAFPDDSLAPEALYEEGREYQQLWNKPSLDPQYGQTALATFRQLLQLYPDSRRVPDAAREVANVNQMFAAKDLETGMHYFRRKAYDPALIYFKDVVRLYPGTPAARGAYIRMVQSYRAINYKEEIAETCTELRRAYATDVEVQRVCGPATTPVRATAAATGVTPAATTPATPPASAPSRPPAPVPQAAQSPASAGGAGRP